LTDVQSAPLVRLPSQSDRIAQAGGEEAACAGGGIDLEDRGAVGLLVQPVLADVAVRADGHVEPRAVAVRDDVLRPVMVERAAGQIDDLRSRAVDARDAVVVSEAHERVGVGNVEVAADQRHPEG
jgi:hypothetical protein